MGFPLDRVRSLDRTGASQSQSTSFSFGPGFLNNEQIGSNKTPYTPTYGESRERFMSLSAMNDYSNKSHEELRYEDYQLGIKSTSSEIEYSEPVQAPLPSSLFSSSPFGNIESKRDHSKQQQASFPSSVFSAPPSQSGLLSAFPGFPIPGPPPTAAYAPPFGKSTSTPQHASQIGTPSSSAQPVFGGFRGCNCKCNCNQRAFPQINSTAPSTNVGTNVFANAGYPYPVYSFPAFVTIRPDAAAAQHFGNFGLTFGESTTSFPASTMLPFGTPALGASTAFGASTTPAFGESTPAFGVSATSAFGVSTTPFGALKTPAFGASTTPAFGASTTPAFGASTTPAFGASTRPAFGASTRPAFGASTMPFGASATPAFGASATPAFPASTTPAFPASTMPAFGASTLPTSGSATSASGFAASTPSSFCFPQSKSAFGVTISRPVLGEPSKNQVYYPPNVVHSTEPAVVSGPVSSKKLFTYPPNEAHSTNRVIVVTEGSDESSSNESSTHVPKDVSYMVEKLGFNPWDQGKYSANMNKNQDDTTEIKEGILACEDADKDDDIIALAEFAVEQHNALHQHKQVKFENVVAACLEAVGGGRYHIALDGIEVASNRGGAFPRRRFYAVVLRKETDRPNHLTVLEKWLPGKRLGFVLIPFS